jgi:hypothetical protein
MPVNNPTNLSNPQITRTLSRATLLLVLNAALDAKELRFARQLALTWLSIYAGDLEVNRTLARIFSLENKTGQTIQILEKVCRMDPEDIQAQKALAKAYGTGNSPDYNRVLVDIFTLGQRVDPSVAMPGWSTILRNARRSLAEGNIDAAETMTYQVLALTQDQLMAAITHIEVIRAHCDQVNLLKFAELYHSQWPETVIFKLALAEARMEVGDEAGAVTLLHQSVAADAAGQVSLRWWGESHPYKPLWPETMEIGLDIAIPASVSTLMGWNRLSAVAGEFIPSTKKPANGTAEAFLKTLEFAYSQEQQGAERAKTREMAAKARDDAKKNPPAWLKKTNTEFEKLAKRMKTPDTARADGRFPIYVVFSSRIGLRNQYGDQTMAVIEKEMTSLAEAVKKRSGWGAMVFYPDDIETTGKLGINTTGQVDPWKLKLALSDLDNALAKKGGRIGALVIVGGPEVVPFHRLPNPTDDLDEEVLSDNPYATLDSNYFVSEWPVGRIMGEAGDDAGLLLQQLRQAVKYQSQVAKGGKTFRRVTQWLSWWRWLLPSRPSAAKVGSFGYTASVWRRSSLATYRPIGEGRTLHISPPVNTGSFDQAKLTGMPLSFFNLHGLAETAEWYGQGDPLERGSGPEYPVALSITDLPKNGHSPKVVFTEACYGGYTMQKTEADSLALRFLSIGTMAVVGSTCVSYGSVTTPLVGADLLGFYFWSALREGYSVGDALVQAKVSMVREMTNRQGFLDGEDQKTLISFVLYGDPLVYHDGVQVSPKKAVRFQNYPEIKTISDGMTEADESRAISEKWLQYAKSAVSPYLPGLDRAEVSVSLQQFMMEGKNHRGVNLNLGRKQAQKQGPDRTVVIFRRQVRMGEHDHIHYARVTMNRDGKLMKMAISR